VLVLTADARKWRTLRAERLSLACKDLPAIIAQVERMLQRAEERLRRAQAGLASAQANMALQQAVSPALVRLPPVTFHQAGRPALGTSCSQ